MQKTIATTASALATLMLIAGTLAPVAYGVTTTAANLCTLRADLTNDEIAKLAPKDKAYPSATAGDNTVLATAGSTLGESGSGALYVTDNWGILCSFSVIKQITNILFLIVAVISVASIVLAAFFFITGGSQPDHIKKAQSALLYAIVGILVATAAKVIPAIALSLIGVH